ncbi:MAG: glutathione S-transferase family protein [bacterium]
MYQLYCARNTYAMGVHVLLEELGVAYQLCEVTLYSDPADPDFIEVSPHARVPALRYAGGTIFESGAIAIYLTDRYGERGFGVATGDPDRPLFLQWMMYLSSTLQPEVLIQFHPENYFADAVQQQQLKKASMARLNNIWSVLDDAYKDGPWIIDNRPTAVDVCLAIQAQWSINFPGSIADFPNVHRMLQTISKRRAYRQVMQWHQGSDD